MIDTLFSNPVVGRQLARRIADRMFLESTLTPMRRMTPEEMDWEKIGQDFRAVGDDIRTAIAKYPNAEVHPSARR